MMQDSWITPEETMRRLTLAGYAADRREDHIAYRKTGVSGRIAIQKTAWMTGCDEVAVFRLEDRGS